MHDDILCVIMSMATEKEAKQRQPGWQSPAPYESTLVCAKPSYWMRRDDSEFIHEFTWKWTAYIE